jgi:hypothetical protein
LVTCETRLIAEVVGRTGQLKRTTTVSALRAGEGLRNCCRRLTLQVAVGPRTVTPTAATADKWVQLLKQDTPWDWFKSTGVVTGGDYGDNHTCYPYTMPFCAHHVKVPGLTDCAHIQKVDPKCNPKCQLDIDYHKDKHKSKSSYSLRSVD